MRLLLCLLPDSVMAECDIESISEFYNLLDALLKRACAFPVLSHQVQTLLHVASRAVSALQVAKPRGFTRLVSSIGAISRITVNICDKKQHLLCDPSQEAVFVGMDQNLNVCVRYGIID
jgi:hypothetical protein